MFVDANANTKDVNEDYELTPDILFARISQLEDELKSGKLVKDSMNELLELYTVSNESN